MIAWLRKRVDPAIQIQAEAMWKAYGPEAYVISANVAHDMRNKGDATRAKQWAKITSYVAEICSKAECGPAARDSR
jgi:hypothetical protein